MLTNLQAFFSQLDNSRNFYVGYSGGLDSHVLLHALRQLAIRFKAVYIDHGLSPHAKAWGEHCGVVCQVLKIPFQYISVNAKPTPGQSPEAAARTARYQAFAKLLQPGDYLITAHHQDDQAETLLLQMLRGAGLKGMSAMPEIKPFANGLHIRPLLAYSRAELLEYASIYQLKWIEDESNQDIRYDRNFIRQQVMPVVRQHWPVAAATLARVTRHVAEAEAVQQWFTARELVKLAGSRPQTIAISRLQAYPKIIQKSLLRAWFNQQHIPLPSEAQLEKMLTEVLHSRTDAAPIVRWQNCQLRRFHDDLYVLPLRHIETSHLVIRWDLQNQLILPQHLGSLVVRRVQGQGINPQQLMNNQITIRFRQGGERCHPEGRAGSHPLKKLLQEWQVPPWQRDQVPLLYIDDKLAAVVGYCVCEPFAISDPEQEGIMVDLQIEAQGIEEKGVSNL